MIVQKKIKRVFFSIKDPDPRSFNKCAGELSKNGIVVNIINNLINTGIVVKDTLILIHRHKKTKDNFNQNLKIIREETYGFSKIIFVGFVPFPYTIPGIKPWFNKDLIL